MKSVVAHLVDALLYKPEGHGFDYLMALWPSGRLSQGYLLGLKAAEARANNHAT
jgi:hypothetical protein